MSPGTHGLGGILCQKSITRLKQSCISGAVPRVTASVYTSPEKSQMAQGLTHIMASFTEDQQQRLHTGVSWKTFLNVWLQSDYQLPDHLFALVCNEAEALLSQPAQGSKGSVPWCHFPYSGGDITLLQAMQHQDPHLKNCRIDPMEHIDNPSHFAAAHLYNAWCIQHPELEWPAFSALLSLGPALGLSWTETMSTQRDALMLKGKGSAIEKGQRAVDFSEVPL